MDKPPRETAHECVSSGAIQHYTAWSSFSRKKWTLRSSTLGEASEGVDLPKPPQDRGTHFFSHAMGAAPTEREVIQNNLSDKKSVGSECREAPHSNQKWRESASSAVNREFGSKRSVVEGIGAPDEAGIVF